MLGPAKPRRKFILVSATLSLVACTGWSVGNQFGFAAEIPKLVADIDAQFDAAWEEASVVPSKSATDGEWCRRLYLDLLGRIPTLEELQSFLATRSRDKRTNLVDRLLSEEYAEEFAEHWSMVWLNLLIGRDTNSGNRRWIDRDGLREYLQESFSANKPYDVLAEELITATGNNRPGEEEFNGAVNFLTGKLSDNAVDATVSTSRIFLGMRVECTQCHNHPFNDWKQSQFWQLNAYFRQARPLRRYREGELNSVYLMDEDFLGEGGNSPDDAEVYFEMRNGRLQVAYPVFVDGQALENHSGRISQVNRRQELAKLIVSSEYLSQAVVNRLWRHFLGRGFVTPVDDMGPHNPPVLPDIFASLNEAFVRQSYDLKFLMRTIVLGKPYSLSSIAHRRNAEDDPDTGSPPLFSRFYARPMDAEQLYASLLVATHADRAIQRSDRRDDAQRDWLARFTREFDSNDDQPPTVFEGTIPQTLMLMNGGLMRQATSLREGSFLYQVAKRNNLDAMEMIDRLYLAALARRATKPEKQIAEALYREHNGKMEKVLQDMWWAILNSNEFLFIH